eukprot:m.185527 g.185527  ORF g.185527 m.185527 type:complete len:240 (+) comp14732_c0_seq5:234-953(+)
MEYGTVRVRCQCCQRFVARARVLAHARGGLHKKRCSSNVQESYMICCMCCFATSNADLMAQHNCDEESLRQAMATSTNTLPPTTSQAPNSITQEPPQGLQLHRVHGTEMVDAPARVKVQDAVLVVHTEPTSPPLPATNPAASTSPALPRLQQPSIQAASIPQPRPQQPISQPSVRSSSALQTVEVPQQASPTLVHRELDAICDMFTDVPVHSRTFTCPTSAASTEFGTWLLQDDLFVGE